MKVSNAMLSVVAGAWCAAILVGLAGMWAYAQRPGPATAAGKMWPSNAHVERAGDRPTLVMFLHPQCSCSRASIAELGVLLARIRTQVSVQLLVYRPSGAPPGWEYTDLWESASRIPGVRLASDEDGAEAVVFGAFSSGATLLYAEDGRLLFNGGVTGARGHEGDSAALDALAAAIDHEGPDVPQTPVFGCLLREDPDMASSSATLPRNP